MHSNISNYVLELDGSIGLKKITGTLQDSWGKYLIYHVFNVDETEYESFYESLASELGNIQDCRPVNSKSKEFSKSRDIKYNPDDYHFYAAKTRQPYHTDHAYYPVNKSPDWAMMYCLSPSEFGGCTRFLTSYKLKTILEKYNLNLLTKLSEEVIWSYEGEKGPEIVKKPIMVNECINWNYWQIRSELNSSEVMKTREEFFKFMEDVIEDGNIYDFSKSWKRGDVVICNDKKVLHGRDAFLGDERWLKYHAIYDR